MDRTAPMCLGPARSGGPGDQVNNARELFAAGPCAMVQPPLAPRRAIFLSCGERAHEACCGCLLSHGAARQTHDSYACAAPRPRPRWQNSFATSRATHCAPNAAIESRKTCLDASSSRLNLVPRRRPPMGPTPRSNRIRLQPRYPLRALRSRARSIGSR